MNHRIGSIAFALAVGLVVAVVAFQWITDPVPRARRQVEEAIVLKARAEVRERLGSRPDLQVSDPLNRNRVAGKTFIYPVDEGWEVSGHYRYGDGTPWYPWLMTLDAGGNVLSFSAHSERLDRQPR